MDPKAGTVAPGEIEDASAAPGPTSYEYQIANYNTNPYTQVLTVTDIGGGSLAVRVEGEFLQGIRVRVGPSMLDASSPGFLARLNMVQFIAPAKAVVTQGAFLVGRDGQESPVQDPETVHVAPLNSCRPSQQASAVKRVQFQSGDKPPVIGLVTVAPYSDTASLVTISLTQGGEIFPTNLNPVVVIGNQVYGLSDAPFKSETDQEITVVVPNSVLRANTQLRVQRLMWGDTFSNTHPFPASAMASDFAISKVTVLAKNKESAVLGISGTELDGTQVISPEDPNHKIKINASAAPTFLVVTIPVNKGDGLNGIVLQKFAANKPASAPIVVPLSGNISKAVADDAAKAGDTTDEKPVKKPVKKVKAKPAASGAKPTKKAHAAQ